MAPIGDESVIFTKTRTIILLFVGFLVLAMVVAYVEMSGSNNSALHDIQLHQREQHVSDSPNELDVMLSGGAANESGGKVVVVDQLAVDIKKLYGAATIDELEINAAMAGNQLLLDSIILKDQANTICNFLHGFAQNGKSTYLVDTIGEFRKPVTKDAMASAVMVDNFRSNFCTHGIALAEYGSGYESYDAYLSAERGINEAAQLGVVQRATDLVSEVNSLPSDEASDAKVKDKIATARGELLDFVASTDSPAAFRRAAELLSDDSPLGRGWYPNGVRERAVWVEGPESIWRTVGVQLAFCQMVGPGCGPNSLAAFDGCMPGNCRPGESVADFLRRTNSPQAMDAAQAYADALLAMRRGKP